MAGYGIWYGVTISWPVVGGCPASELRHHLSERVPTDAGPMFTSLSMLITNDAVKGILSHRLLKFSDFVPRKRFKLHQIIL